MFDEKKYQETFAQVQASDETLLEVLNMTRKKHPGVRLTRVLVIAAVISAMMATTVFAYVGFTQYENPMVMLKTFFGDDSQPINAGAIVDETYYGYTYTRVEPTIEWVPMDEQIAESDVAPYVSDVGQSITYEDYTLTIEAHLYDSATDCGVIYYALENPNGVSGYKLQYNDEVWWPDGEKTVILNCAGNSYLIEEETTATKLSIAYYYCGVYNDADALEVRFTQWIAEGEYDAAELESQVLYLPLEDGGGMKRATTVEGDISVSPIAIRLDISRMDFLRQIEPYDKSLSEPLESNIDMISLQFKDGSEYVIQNEELHIDNTMYALVTEDGYVVSYSFNRLIDVDNVASVLINDMEFTIE